MLQSIRSKASSWIVKILFVLLIASFAVWGIGDIFRGGTSTTVAEVGDVTITTVALDREFQQQLGQLRQIFGGGLDTEQAIAMGLLDQSLNALIDRALFDLAAQDLGLRLDDAAVAAQIQQSPAFRNELGRFDPDLFRRVLASNRLSEAEFAQSVRGEIARSLVAGAVTAGSQPPARLVADLYRHRNERRVAETVFVPRSAFQEVGEPDAETLAAFHQEHAVRFTAPEYRALTLLELRLDDIAAEIAVSDAALQEAYDARAAEFQMPERRDLAQVLVPDEGTAKQVVARVRDGEPLAQAAAAAGAEVIPIPDVTPDDLLPELSEVAFELPVGEVGEPVETPLGWHVVQVTAVTPPSERSLEEVRDLLLADLRREQALDSIFELANRLDDAIAGGATIEEAAEQLDLPVTRIEAVDATGTRPDGTRIAEIPHLDRVLATAFGLGEGEESTLQEVPDGGYYLVRVDKVMPPALRPLEQVRDQVLAAWQDQRRAELAAARAEEIAAALRQGAEPQALATGGAEAGTTAPFTRDGADAGRLPPGLVEELFALESGAVATAATPDGHLVARLSEILPADPAQAGPAREELEAELARQIAQDRLAAFSNALRQRYEVTVNRRVIETMYIN